MTTQTARRDIHAHVADTRYTIDQVAREGAAQRGELGVTAYVVAHDLDLAPVAIDVADLHALFQCSRLEAAAALAMLSRPQFIAEAWAYAAYLNQIGRDVTADLVLHNWTRGLLAYGVEVH